MSSDNGSALIMHDTHAAGQACSLQQIFGHIEANSFSDNSVAHVKRTSAKAKRIETQTQRDVRLATLRERAATRKLNETKEDRSLRLSVDAKRARLRRSTETEQKKTERLAKKAEGARKTRLALAEQKRSSRLCGQNSCRDATSSRLDDSPIVEHPTSSLNIETPSEGNHSETSAPDSVTMVSENFATQASLEMETTFSVTMPAPYSILRAKGRRGDIAKITILNTLETQAHITCHLFNRPGHHKVLLQPLLPALGYVLLYRKYSFLSSKFIQLLKEMLALRRQTLLPMLKTYGIEAEEHQLKLREDVSKPNHKGANVLEQTK
ncbi:unnamed protein product [Cylicostephanus goldi]|uniref:Uncharacterized protein n=1 Tax=Cylicostephanus goldi TaxID=71465 RepID=A0A3P7Q9D8_CYLGO|nr:unnamed protein product [Cylicostephanus goldi]